MNNTYDCNGNHQKKKEKKKETKRKTSIQVTIMSNTCSQIVIVAPKKWKEKSHMRNDK